MTACLAVVILCLLSSPALAQSGVNSPYSRYGLGLLSDQSTGITRSMGGIGTGFRRANTLNLKNPASYSTVDTLTFIADLGFSIQNGNYSENGVSINARNASVSHMAMQFRVQPKIGMTVAIKPFSNIGYDFSSTSVVRRDEDGEITATNSYSGTGGLRQFMAGLGWRPTEWLSVGANASLLTGDITHKVSNTYSSSAVQSRVKTYTADMTAFVLDFGAQTTVPLGKDKLVLGFEYTPAQKLACDANMSDVHSSGDTTSIPNAFRFPDIMSAGFTYQWDKGMIGADVSYQTWSKARFFAQDYGLDRITAAAGFMYCPDESSKNVLKHSSYQAGINVSQPYFRVDNKKGPMQFGISAGITLPITSTFDSMSYLHISGEYVRVQPMSKGMITENYLKINVGVTFMERWFMKIMVD